MGMLVISRYAGESLIIDHTIKVTIVEVRGDKVRIGVDAPRELSVHREEIEKKFHSKQEHEDNDA